MIDAVVQGFRRPQHRRQQCRPRAAATLRRDQARGLAPPDRHLPLWRDPLLSRRRAPSREPASTAASSASSAIPRGSANPGLAIVAAARAGVVALMKSLAREFGRSGTTANTVSLGLVETAHDRDWVEANREKLTRLYPLRRLGQSGRRGADGGVAGLAAERLDHRAGGQHQRRLQHGLTTAGAHNEKRRFKRLGNKRCCTPT